MEHIIKISEFVLYSFLHIWPYLLLTIPLAVIVNLSGASKYITRAFAGSPFISVLLATAVGAFSPFCSCGVIPVISSLLIGGVPLAPVMSFWIASPSMDPEIFFLSSSVIGWELAIWRLVATFTISLAAGYLTYLATVKGVIGNDILRTQKQVQKNKGCSGSFESATCNCREPGKVEEKAFSHRVFDEIVKATFLVTKFMGIAFFITALIKFYLPGDIISGIVTAKPLNQVFLAILIGIPMYTSNLTALPIVGGLLEVGFNEGAALAFLIAGATTTLPALVAVWGITKPKIFVLYLSFVLIGALISGMLFNLIA